MTALNRTYEEKRDFIRMKVDTPAILRIKPSEQYNQGETSSSLKNTSSKSKTQNECSIQGMCYEISGGGILLELEQELLIGTKATVIIQSNTGHHPILHAEIEVKRIAYRPQPDSEESIKTFCVGAEITKVLN